MQPNMENTVIAKQDLLLLKKYRWLYAPFMTRCVKVNSSYSLNDV